MSAGDALLAALPPVVLVLGKGGVGKTTCAAALALRAGGTQSTLLLSTDPARALPSVLAHDVGAEATPLRYAPRVAARMLDAPVLRDAFMAEWRDVLATILDRGTYLDDADIGPLVDTALPGADEIFAALELARLFEDTTWDRIVIDTAPTGHTLRLLALPGTFRALVRLLDAMQDKHRFMVRTLTRAYRADAADGFLAALGRQVEVLESTLRDAARCGAILIANGEPVVVAETTRYLAALRELRIPVRAVVWNGTSDGVPDLDVAEQFAVPRLPESPVGPEGLGAWWSALRPARPATRGHRPVHAHTPGRTGTFSGRDLLAPLTIVAGKGGVGKTTVAAALALDSARDRTTLVVSTDPAPSLGDAFGRPIPDADTPIDGVAGLTARQMDATAAFDRLRREYSDRVDALFDTLVGRGVNLDRDRAIVRDLLRLAPPGVDEVYALSLISDALFQQRYQRVIVDPAPTGHLLRLLEMPQLALAWTHQLMRLMLKYKDVAGLGETARELLDFSRNLRSLDALLRDSGRCGIVLVTLEEPVVRAESERLAAEATRRGVAVRAVVHNRARQGSLPVGGAGVQVVAPPAGATLVGVDAIREWMSTWERSDDRPVTSHA